MSFILICFYRRAHSGLLYIFVKKKKIGITNCCCDQSATKLKSSPSAAICFRENNVSGNFNANEARHCSDKKTSPICRLMGGLDKY